MSQPATQPPPAPSDGAEAGTTSNDLRIAAIDIGSNSVRIVVAQQTPDGYRVLDEERENTRLAASLTATGELGREAVDATVAALRSFVTIARGYSVATIRAIATSAVRDASNGPAFCTMVHDDLGLTVEVISPREEGRLSFLSVARAFDVAGKRVAVADIGGGSAEIVLATAGIVEDVYTTQLGAVRIAEQCGLTGRCGSGRLAQAEDFIDAELKRHARKPSFVPSMLYGAGGTFTAMATMLLAREGAAEDASVRGYRANRAAVRHLLADLAKMSLEERAKVSGLNPRRADIIVAGLLVIDRILRHFDVNEVQVHTGGVRDGVLLTMTRESRAAEGPATPAERREAVERFAQRCGADLPHARHVARLAGRLWEELAEPLALRCEDRDLLETSALLANVGYLINFEKHHKHSYQLIRNSDLAGFERDDLRIVANVARYHRGAPPKQKHGHYAALSDDDQDRVAKMAAMLRLALALDRTHQQQVLDLRARVTEARVEVTVQTTGDAEVDLWAARRKVDLFERVFGRPVYFAAVGE